jgi:hypothetical protein
MIKQVTGGEGVVVDDVRDDGQVRVRPLGDGSVEFAVLPARGTFPGVTSVGPAEARALAAEILRITPEEV